MAFPLVSGTVGDPTDVHAGMVSKRVRVSTVSAGTLASSFESGDTVDGVTLATGDRILIKDQASGAENGIYTVNASGTPTRALDFDESAEVLPGTLVVVSEGTSNKDSIWQLTTNATITVGTTALIFFPVHLQGTGSPESAVTAPVGATYRRTDGSTSTTFYVKESGTGNTGWVAVAASSVTEITISSSGFSATNGSPTLGPLLSAAYWPLWLLDSASQEGISAQFYCPTGWATVDVDMYWTNAGAGSGNCALDARFNTFGDGETISAPGTANTQTIAAPAQNVMKKSTILTGQTVTAGEIASLTVFRDGANGADTLGNDMGVAFVRVRKAS